MHLLPRERDKLHLFQAGSVAQRRLARGLRLNVSEATALIAWTLQEKARDGVLSVAELMSWGKNILGRVHVLGDVPHLLHQVMIEATMPDGSFLVTIHDPVSTVEGNLESALFASGLTPPDPQVFLKGPPKALSGPELPGAIVVKKDAPPIVLNEGRERISIRVTNIGDRPIQVGSHYPFIETNPYLSFPRLETLGKKLDIAAGTAVRFEPGDVRTVTLVAVGGQRPYLAGGNSVATGYLDEIDLDHVAEKLLAMGCPKSDVQVPRRTGGRSSKSSRTEPPAPATLTREAYVALYGPTVGDRVRLADTELWVEVEKDYTSYGDECKFGGGKVLRDGMGQASGAGDDDTLDTVIMNALILDWSGVIKADIGLKGGKIVGIGKAGNPGMMDGVTPGMVVGSCTEVIAGEGMIVTATALDSHVHYICPDLFHEALATGVTTLIGGGTGPSAGSSATTCTPGKENVRRMLQATDGVPLNFVFTGKGNDSGKPGLRAQIEAGCGGLKVHEDWGTTPSAIDNCLTLCDEYDVQCLIHTDTLNESSFVERTIDTFKGRTIHAYHSEGAGGGHAPDIIRVAGVENVIPSSTNPTRPYAKNTLDEHVDMLMVCHHLSRDIAEDVAFADSRIRAETVAAEDVMQDLGALSIISSDSQAMGRIGEVISRTWRTAAKMRSIRGPLQHPPEGLPKDTEGNDNSRARRYVAKYTINPAIAQGLSHLLGSVEVGKWADLILYKPAYFGTKPEMVLKGGQISWAQMGDANGSIPTVQPIYGRAMFATFPEAAHKNSFAFVSKASIDKGIIASYGLKKNTTPCVKTRGIGKRDMKLNDSLPKITVDPETYDVHADGELMSVPAATELPMTQRTHFF